MEKEIKQSMEILEAKKRRAEIEQQMKQDKIDAKEAKAAERMIKEQKEKNKRKRNFSKRLKALLVGGVVLLGAGKIAKSEYDTRDLASDANGKLIENFMDMEEKEYYNLSEEELEQLSGFSDSIKTYKDLKDESIISESDNLKLAQARAQIYETGNGILPDLYMKVIKGEIAKAYDKPVEDITIMAREEGTEITAKAKGEKTLEPQLIGLKNKLDSGIAEAIKDMYDIKSSKSNISVEELVKYYDRMEGLYNRTFEVTKNNNVVQTKENQNEK